MATASVTVPGSGLIPCPLPATAEDAICAAQKMQPGGLKNAVLSQGVQHLEPGTALEAAAYTLVSYDTFGSCAINIPRTERRGINLKQLSQLVDFIRDHAHLWVETCASEQALGAQVRLEAFAISMRLGLQHSSSGFTGTAPEALQVHFGDPGDPETLRWVNSGQHNYLEVLVQRPDFTPCFQNETFKLTREDWLILCWYDKEPEDGPKVVNFDLEVLAMLHFGVRDRRQLHHPLPPFVCQCLFFHDLRLAELEESQIDPLLVMDIIWKVCGEEILLEAFELEDALIPAGQRHWRLVFASVASALDERMAYASYQEGKPYRHVDTLSIINVPEMENFIGYWNGVLLENAMQRTGFMYGYYLEDKNYDEGTRAIMEGIYEPSQEMVGEIAEPLTDDQEMSRVNRIAEALGLECIGWVFTSLPLEDDLLLSPEEVLRIARLQNEHSTDAHFTRYVLSKFVTCAVRPDPANNGAPSVNPFMVSEQACAMLRDGILSSAPSERRACLVREAKPDELIPDFVVEGRSDKKIATDFFIVRVNDTAPKKHQRMFTHADFPRENRPTHPQRREDLKKDFSKKTSATQLLQQNTEI
eukprot:s2461_g5.t1